MRNHFDQLAKQLGRAALGRSGAIVVHDEISPEIQHADLRHEPNPKRTAERKRLGLLGRIASVLCLIEIYGHAPTAEELRACLGKHIAFWQQRTRKTRADNKKRQGQGLPPRAPIKPFLWIISAGVPSTLLAKLEPTPAKLAPGGWPDGVYFLGDDVLRVGLIVASELPRERSTLLVRLMAAGALLAQATEELRALPPNAPERAVAEQILLNFQRFLGKKSNRTPTEQEFIKAMQRTWEHARAEGRAEGSTNRLANDVLTVLQVRGIAVSAAARKRILAQKDQAQLERWLKKAIVATSLGEVIGNRS